MSDALVTQLGVYGACIAIGFVAGMFPLVSIEAFLVGWVSFEPVTWPSFAALVLCAALGHQISKTACYFAGAGALEHGRAQRLLEKWRPRIERWNRYPWTVFCLAGAIGLPPMWLIGFIARPIMKLRFVPFTAAGFSLRTLRYAVLALIPMLAK